MLENRNSQRRSDRPNRQYENITLGYFIRNFCVGVPRSRNLSLFVMFGVPSRITKKPNREKADDWRLYLHSSRRRQLNFKHQDKHGWSEDKLFQFFSLLLGSVGLTSEKHKLTGNIKIQFNNKQCFVLGDPLLMKMSPEWQLLSTYNMQVLIVGIYAYRVSYGRLNKWKLSWR